MTIINQQPSPVPFPEGGTVAGSVPGTVEHGIGGGNGQLHDWSRGKSSVSLGSNDVRITKDIVKVGSGRPLRGNRRPRRLFVDSGEPYMHSSVFSPLRIPELSDNADVEHEEPVCAREMLCCLLAITLLTQNDHKLHLASSAAHIKPQKSDER